MQLSKFMGTDSNSIIQVNKGLTVKPGSNVTMRLRKPLSGAGGGDDGDIEGNEEAMTWYNYEIEVHERNHGVRSNGKMTEQFTKIDIRREATEALGDWSAEQLENDLVYAMAGLGNQDTYAGEGTADIKTVNEHAPSTNRILYGGQTAAGALTWVASDSAIGDDDETDYKDYKFGTKVIEVAHRKAQLASPKFRPVMIGGRGYYVMFIHPLQTKALKNESSTVNSWSEIQKSANVRGPGNPLFGKKGSGPERMFDGIIGIWDDVILYELDRIPTRIAGEVFDSGDTIDTYIADGTARIARALLCGAQAAGIAWAQMWRRYEKDFDYGRKPGTAMDAIYGVSKTQWNDPGIAQSANDAQDDFAVIAIDTAVAED